MIKTYGQNQALDKNLHFILPPTTHLLGYAGYAISEQLMIPYPIKDDMIEFLELGIITTIHVLGSL